LRRLRLHLNTDLRHLSNVTWNPAARQSAMEVAATAVDGVRERFWMRVADPEQLWHLDEVLRLAFRDRPSTRLAAVGSAATPQRPAARERLNVAAA
ncbi:MAG TPA: hypothetical protein VFO77_05595, partial [Actinoplanes sp.]|nr:hypothetical protein [Actinoplanes sp.]